MVMTKEMAIRILEIALDDYHGYARDLSFNPTKDDIYAAIQVALDEIGK